MCTQTYLQNRKNLTDSENELMVAVGKGMVKDFGKVMLYLKQITNKNLLHSTWNSVQCYMAAWMGGDSEGEWIHVYIWLSPCAIQLKLS